MWRKGELFRIRAAARTASARTRHREEVDYSSEGGAGGGAAARRWEYAGNEETLTGGRKRRMRGVVGRIIAAVAWILPERIYKEYRAVKFAIKGMFDCVVWSF